MEQEDVMRFNDAKRKSFNNGWKAAVKATIGYIFIYKCTKCGKFKIVKT